MELLRSNLRFSLRRSENGAPGETSLYNSIKSSFPWSVDCDSLLPSFCISKLSDWFTKLTPLCYPIRNKTKTTGDSHKHVFPRFTSETSASSFDWFTALSVSFVIGYSDYFGVLYKEVFPGKTEAHLSVTVDVRGSNSKWRAIWIHER